MPTLQKKTYMYCPNNQYTFATTCAPGKKLRYDLQIFCEEYSEMCGVPNINLFPSRYRSNGDFHHNGYGQKQENGHLGLGRSLSVGVGIVPGLTFTSARGADVGSMPGLDQIGGVMFNEGTDVGILGERTGKGPDRSMYALSRGIPTFGLVPGNEAADSRAADAALRSLGIPPVPGLGKVLGSLKPKKRGRGPQFEPGYDAINKNAPLAFGRSDGDNVNVPAVGTVETIHGVGMGIGKK
ncbi:Protein C38C6.3 [Aphelenchoides avenae]|nr:Protein C38C6.3 [Aphelenchus avenae]